MALKSYAVTQDFAAPYVVATGIPHNPSKILIRKFKRGQIVNGELKHANNKPAFVLVQGTLVLPLHVVREVVTKQIGSDGSVTSEVAKISNADGDAKNVKPSKFAKVKYVDAALIGALIGLGGVILADKQGWIAVPDKKHKLYGAAGGAALLLYIVYRLKNK